MTSSLARSLGRLGLVLTGGLVVTSACGGKAIIDPVGGDGGASSSTSTSSQGGSDVGAVSVAVGTSTGTGCTCTTDEQCPEIDDACFEYTCDGCQCVETPLPAGSICMSGVCDGASNCVECIDDGDCPNGSCVNQSCSDLGVPAVCDAICGAFEMCMVEPGCTPGCFQALQDCTGAELAQVLDCQDFLVPQCDIQGAEDCILAVPCAQN